MNGVQVQKDGKEVTETEVQTTVTSPIETEPQGLTAERVAGSYYISGSVTWVDYEDDEFSGTEQVSATITFTYVGGNTLSLRGEDGGVGQGTYNPETGKLSIYDAEEEMNYYFTFTENDGVISVSMSYDQIYEDGRSYGSFSGTKQ